MYPVEAQHTAPGSVDASGQFAADRAAWRQSRYQALVDGLIVRGMPQPQAINVGLQLMPLLARETGNGTAEYNYNVGNLRPSSSGLVGAGQQGWRGAYNTRTHGRYRAYDSLADGTADFLRLLTTTRYDAAYQHLLSTGDVEEFYERLIRAGYYPADEAEIARARAEYARGYANMQSYGLRYVPMANAGLGLLALAGIVGAGVWLLYRSRRWGRR